MKPWIPHSFTVPAGFETADYLVRMLTINDLVKDYDAVMTSAAHLKGVLSPDSSWPDGLTLEEDLIDLGWHQKEFQRRTSFAYTVMSLDESRCLGCIYLYPSDKSEFDVKACLWVRESELQSGLDDRLYDAVKAWLSSVWPFDKVAFPGREIPWSDWIRLPPAATVP